MDDATRRDPCSCCLGLHWIPDTADLAGRCADLEAHTTAVVLYFEGIPAHECPHCIQEAPIPPLRNPSDTEALAASLLRLAVWVHEATHEDGVHVGARRLRRASDALADAFGAARQLCEHGLPAGDDERPGDPWHYWHAWDPHCTAANADHCRRIHGDDERT